MVPPADETVREWTAALGLPGLVDVHTHFLPPPVMAKVRAQFDAAGPLIGRPWPLQYRDSDEALVEVLRSIGVARFTALPYAHRPGMADWLNDWAAGLRGRGARGRRVRHVLPRGVRGVVRRRPARTRSRSSRCTCRSAASTSPTRCWTGRGDWWPRQVRRSCCTRAAARSPPSTRAPARWPRCWPGTRGCGWSSPTPAPRSTPSSSPWPSGTSGWRSTPRWPSPTSSPRWAGSTPRRCCPGCVTSGWPARCCSAPTSRTSPTRTHTSSRRSAGSTSATTGCAPSAGTTATPHREQPMIFVVQRHQATQPALRPPARGRRRPGVVGRAEGAVARPAGQAPGGAGRRPRSGPRDLRGAAR